MAVVLEKGANFAGRYRVVRCLAAGGMGAVYEVVHLGTERRCALKVMHAEVLQNSELRERFKREARAAALIDSDYVVEILDAGFDDTTQMPFLVMELLRGEPLDKRLKRLGRFEPRAALRYLHHTAIALEAAHKVAIVHRDLKPGNLFLVERDDGETRVKVLDFGIAKIMGDEMASTGLTNSSLGTPAYMAPEQFINGVITPSSDVFSLGMLAYTFLVGRTYWSQDLKGSSLVAFAKVALGGPKEAASVRAARHDVKLPAGFDAWFLKATAIRVNQRFSSAREAILSLADVLGESPPQSIAARRSRTSLMPPELSGSPPTVVQANTVNPATPTPVTAISPHTAVTASPITVIPPPQLPVSPALPFRLASHFPSIIEPQVNEIDVLFDSDEDVTLPSARQDATWIATTVTPTTFRSPKRRPIVALALVAAGLGLGIGVVFMAFSFEQELIPPSGVNTVDATTQVPTAASPPARESLEKFPPLASGAAVAPKPRIEEDAEKALDEGDAGRASPSATTTPTSFGTARPRPRRRPLYSRQ